MIKIINFVAIKVLLEKIILFSIDHFIKVLVEEEEEVFTEEEVEEIKPRRVRSQRKVSMHFLLPAQFSKGAQKI